MYYGGSGIFGGGGGSSVITLWRLTSHGDNVYVSANPCLANLVGTSSLTISWQSNN